MFCVNVVHSQIVTGWALILHIYFTLNNSLKFNIKIQIYFHNTQRYCGNTATGLALMQHKAFSFLRGGASTPDSLTRGSAPGSRWGHSPPDPQHIPPIVCYFPQTWSVWIKACMYMYVSILYSFGDFSVIFENLEIS